MIYARRFFTCFVFLGCNTTWAGSSCGDYSAGKQVGTITTHGLQEASGLSYSQINSGIFWTHPDNHNPAILYALHADGSLADQFTVAGASNTGWEDIAVGPCPDFCSCLYIADIGDNSLSHTTHTIYRFPEPILGETQTVTAQATALSYVYPNGQVYDAETMLVDPRTRDIYVATHSDNGHNQVYRFPNPDATQFPVTLEYVGEAVFYGYKATDRRATGGAVAPDGGRFVIRSRSYAYEWTVDPDQSIADALLTPPDFIQLPETEQGEGISYSSDGLSLITSSEQLPSPLYQLDCQNISAAASADTGWSDACDNAAISGTVAGCGCASQPTPRNLALLLSISLIAWRTRRNPGWNLLLLGWAGTAQAAPPVWFPPGPTWENPEKQLLSEKGLDPILFVQGRFMWDDGGAGGVESDGQTPINKTGFSFNLIGMGLEYHPVPWTIGRLEIEANEKHIRITDAMVGLVDAWTPLHLQLSLGQFILPFGQEMAVFPADWQMPELSPFLDDFFPNSRDRGVQLSAHWRFVELSGALVNGNGIADNDSQARYIASEDQNGDGIISDDEQRSHSIGQVDFGTTDRDQHMDVVGRAGLKLSHFRLGVSGYQGSWGRLPQLQKVTDPQTGETIYDGVNDLIYTPKVRWGVDMKLHGTILGWLGESSLQGEFIKGRGTFPEGDLLDVAAMGWSVLVTQQFYHWATPGVRISQYYPDLADPHQTTLYLESSLVILPDAPLSVLLAYRYRNHWGGDGMQAIGQIQARF